MKGHSSGRGHPLGSGSHCHVRSTTRVRYLANEEVVVRATADNMANEAPAPTLGSPPAHQHRLRRLYLYMQIFENNPFYFFIR